MNIAEDFEKMGEQFTTDFKHRMGTIRTLFGDTHHMLAQVRPPLAAFRREFSQEMKKRMMAIRAQHRKMSTELRAELEKAAHAIRTETKGMLQGFQTEGNKRKMEMKHMHGAAQSFFRRMAQARHMHPLRGHATTEHAPKATRRKRAHSKAEATA